ncbi:MAG: hypothetical protein ACE5WD_09695 [Candidatus Aminicenantia bacterium]
MNKKFFKIIWFIFVSAIFLIIGSVKPAEAGFGISPSHIQNQLLYPGASFETRIILSRGQPTEDLRAEISIDAPEVEDWITINPGTEFLLPKGEQRVPMFVNIDIPEDAEYKNYKGYIYVKTVPVEAEKRGGVAIALGARLDLDLTVTEIEIIDFIIRNLRIQSSEEGFHWWKIALPTKIKLLMNVENTGNVEAAPNRVKIEIWDLNWKDLIAESVDSSLAKVKPFEKKEVTAVFPLELGPGDYWTKISVFKDEKEMLREGKLPLKITPFEMSRQDWAIVAAIIAITVLIIVLLIIIIRRKGVFGKLALSSKKVRCEKKV